MSVVKIERGKAGGNSQPGNTEQHREILLPQSNHTPETGTSQQKTKKSNKKIKKEKEQ